MMDRTTLYVSMLPYSYTNNDVAQLFIPFGKVAHVTILRDKKTRASRGVAFVKFNSTSMAQNALVNMNGKQVGDLTLAISFVKDNGRRSEVAAAKKEKNKQNLKTLKCFECGVEGHVSYKCPKNVLGERKRLVTKRRKKYSLGYEKQNDSDSDEVSMSAFCLPVTTVDKKPVRRVLQKDSYFSDEDKKD